MSYKEILVNPMRGCTPQCQEIYIDGWHMRECTSFINNNRVVAYLDINNYDDFIKKIKKRCKGNIIRDARKADNYSCNIFNFKEYIPGVVKINHSKEVRCGGPMTPAYCRSIEEVSKIDSKFMATTDPLCKKHYDLMWGIFDDKELLAYIRLRRIGDYAQYAQILGHGDYLKYGIMYKLHLEVMRWLCSQDELSVGIKHVWYCDWFTVGGLMLWKKKAGFDPAILKEVQP